MDEVWSFHSKRKSLFLNNLLIVWRSEPNVRSVNEVIKELAGVFSFAGCIFGFF
jgi:hypothetical protein